MMMVSSLPAHVLDISTVNEEAKDNFMKRVNELTQNENDPFKKYKETKNKKKKNPEKVHLQAVEKYLRDVEDKAKEEKHMMIQQRPLNEEVIKKEFSKGIASKFNIIKCDLCIQKLSHSFFECINHQQMIKLMGKKEAAHEVKGILQQQIRDKKAKELQERTDMITVTFLLNSRILELKATWGIQDVRSYPKMNVKG